MTTPETTTTLEVATTPETTTTPEPSTTPGPSTTALDDPTKVPANFKIYCTFPRSENDKVCANPGEGQNLLFQVVRHPLDPIDGTELQKFDTFDVEVEVLLDRLLSGLRPAPADGNRVKLPKTSFDVPQSKGMPVLPFSFSVPHTFETPGHYMVTAKITGMKNNSGGSPVEATRGTSDIFGATFERPDGQGVGEEEIADNNQIVEDAKDD